MKLDLKKLKNGELQAAKVELTKINIKKKQKDIGVVSENVKTYMYLPNAKRYYALNDRTVNLLMKGNVDMSATTGEAGDDESGNPTSFSDIEVKYLVTKEQEVELFTVDKNKTRAGGSFFPYLNSTIFDLSKHCIS